MGINRTAVRGVGADMGTLRDRVRRIVPGVVLAAGLVVAPATGAAAAAPPSTPWTWGGNAFGQRGDGTTTTRLAAGPVTGLGDVIDLHGGREHTVALRSDGTVWVWGSNVSGQLGLGTTSNVSVPTRVASLSGAVAVETGHDHSLALLGDGSVWTWGLNSDGQPGTAPRRSAALPCASRDSPTRSRSRPGAT